MIIDLIVNHTFRFIGIAWALIIGYEVMIWAMPKMVRYVRAWLYVRFFIRYEMAGCAVEAKAREGMK
ncbi:hypothetical protein [Luteibacter sp. SG786]|uniref:hypothetical protein n=1 Tax=Luteibacter sp. SG786 TaxID=2587130 RepID=UPI00141EF677|nr:hypothetical protein [Luteibacter sp. SG786]NII54381.1 hypothetical protein [Luteibacter sp. SG786]